MASSSELYPRYMELCNGWAEFLHDDATKAILDPILAALKTPYYPAPENLFRCFYMTPLESVKVVIIGQDPYHNGSATGLCFDVKLGCQLNPSLHNIYKELTNEGFYPTKDGNLTQWARQGVLLINTALSVAPGQPESHLEMWRPFFEHVLRFLCTRNNIVWVLFGKKAMDYRADILDANGTHHVVCTSHPSPLSATRKSGDAPAFIGSGVFGAVNEQLKAMGHAPVVW